MLRYNYDTTHDDCSTCFKALVELVGFVLSGQHEQAVNGLHDSEGQYHMGWMRLIQPRTKTLK